MPLSDGGGDDPGAWPRRRDGGDRGLHEMMLYSLRVVQEFRERFSSLFAESIERCAKTPLLRYPQGLLVVAVDPVVVVELDAKVLDGKTVPLREGMLCSGAGPCMMGRVIRRCAAYGPHQGSVDVRLPQLPDGEQGNGW